MNSDKSRCRPVIPECVPGGDEDKGESVTRDRDIRVNTRGG